MESWMNGTPLAADVAEPCQSCNKVKCERGQHEFNPIYCTRKGQHSKKSWNIAHSYQLQQTLVGGYIFIFGPWRFFFRFLQCRFVKPRSQMIPAHPGFWSLRKWFFPFQLDSSPGGWPMAAWFEQDTGAAVGLEVWFVPTYSLVLVLEPLNLDRTVSSRPTKKGWDNHQLWTSSG